MDSSGPTFSVRGVAHFLPARRFPENYPHIGHFYLTELLLPTLISSAEDSPPGAVRVVTVSSIAHNFGAPPSGIHWDTLGPNADTGRRKKVGSMNLYSQSKLVSFVPPRVDVKQ
jgi:NAD(P)-dependent dehydrogenase (short-subunit alcohol dehydrogenase family)